MTAGHFKVATKKKFKIIFLKCFCFFLVGSCLKQCFAKKVMHLRLDVLMESCLLTWHSFATKNNYFDRSVSCCPAIQSCGK